MKREGEETGRGSVETGQALHHCLRANEPMSTQQGSASEALTLAKTSPHTQRVNINRASVYRRLQDESPTAYGVNSSCRAYGGFSC